MAFAAYGGVTLLAFIDSVRSGDTSGSEWLFTQ